MGKSRDVGSTIYAEGPPTRNTMEGKGCLHKFPVGEKVHASTFRFSGILLPLLAVRPWGSYSNFLYLNVPPVKWRNNRTCFIGML